MDADAFWQIISEARLSSGGSMDGDEVAEHVSAQLALSSAREIIEFAVFFDELREAAYRWDLWAAAYLINGGCSDDSFDYFRGWLVTRGRHVWEAAMADPDSLADVPLDPESDAECYSEDMLGAAMIAYGRVTGDEDAYWEALPPADEGATAEPAGEDFDFDDDNEMRSRLPRLAALHLHQEQ